MIWKSVIELENRHGRLHIGGCDAVELTKRYGTPLYVYAEDRIRSNYRRLVKAYTKYYHKFKVYYAVKANNNPAIVSVLRSEGAGADASCPAEIMIARMCGIKDEDILYSGVYNTDEELRYAVDNKVRLNIEDISQLERLGKIGVPEFLCFRINPGIGKGGKEGLVFAGPDAKFGIIERDARKAYMMAKELGVKRFGIHMMTGSNVLDVSYYKETVAKLMDIAGPIAKELGIKFEFVDIGGSLGVPYTPEQEELDIDEVARTVTEVFKEKTKRYDMGEPWLIHEPGRYLVCDAGVLLSNVASIKNGYKRFIGIDAGMNTLIRPAMYGSYHHILYANHLDSAESEKVNVVGPVCENTDQFAKDRMLPKGIGVGDTLALLDAGAYGFGMSSQYNTRPQAAEVLVSGGRSDLIRRRQKDSDLLRDIIQLDRLRK
jgi:diaminopimelate decarboxylase